MVAAETGLKSDGMFAIIIHTALFITILFTLFQTEVFQLSIPTRLKTVVGVYI